MNWWQLTKGGAIILSLGMLLVGILTGISALIKEGNWRPLADNSIGMLLEGDNKAYQMEQDIIGGKFEDVPELYREEIKKAMWTHVFTNMFLSVFFMILLFKLFSWLWGSRQFEPSFDIMSVILSILAYVFLAVTYTFFITWQRVGTFTIDKYILMSAIPLKSLVYFFWKLPVLLSGAGL